MGERLLQITLCSERFIVKRKILVFRFGNCARIIIIIYILPVTYIAYIHLLNDDDADQMEISRVWQFENFVLNTYINSRAHRTKHTHIYLYIIWFKLN